MKIIYGLALFLSTAQYSIACENGFFPQNNLFIPANTQNALAKNAEAGMITKAIENIYNPVFAKDGKKLFINFKWKNPAVNAYATRDDHNNPVINITGGMLGHDLLGQDGLALILCHEVGHFLGGSPKKLRGRSTKKSWSSAEGQADYFATANCLKKVFRVVPKTVSVEKLKIKSDHKSKQVIRLQQETTKICKDPICKRVAMASHNVAEVYASIDYYSGELSLVNKDDYAVYQTIYDHPNPQCRLDTMVAALQCSDSESILFKDGNELASACKNPKYRRPRCWFYPSTSF